MLRAQLTSYSLNSSLHSNKNLENLPLSVTDVRLSYMRWFEHFLQALSLCGWEEHVRSTRVLQESFYGREEEGEEGWASQARFRLQLSYGEGKLARCSHSFNQPNGKQLLSTCNVQGECAQCRRQRVERDRQGPCPYKPHDPGRTKDMKNNKLWTAHFLMGLSQVF